MILSARVLRPSSRNRLPSLIAQRFVFDDNDRIKNDTGTMHKQKGFVPCHREFHATARNFFSAKNSDLLVVLDMDECLIHSRFHSQNVDYRQHESRPDELDNTSGIENFTLELEDCELVTVNKRPGLDKFIRKVSERWETYIFTAAMSSYASPVLSYLDPDDDIFSERFFRESCTIDEDRGVYVKDLTKIISDDRDLKRCVLVDNNPLSFLAQPRNGILVSNFYDDVDDDTLPAVYKLLDVLDNDDDCRIRLNELFGLSEALEDCYPAKKKR